MIQNRGSNMVDNASSSPVNNNHVIMTSLLLLNFIYVLERILILSLYTRSCKHIESVVYCFYNTTLGKID